MRRVGARQRREDARGRPTRYLRHAHRLHQRFRQFAQQRQTSAHPTGVARALLGRLALAQPMAVDQLAQHQRLLDRGERARHRARQHLCQRLAHRAIPALHQRRIAPQPRERVHAPIAVDEHQCATPGLLRSNACHQLPIRVYRIGQPLHGARIHDAHGREAQLQAVQVDRLGHARHERASLRHAKCRRCSGFRVIGHAQFLPTRRARLPGALRDAGNRDGPRPSRLERTSGNALAATFRAAPRPVHHRSPPPGNPDASLFFCAPRWR